MTKTKQIAVRCEHTEMVAPKTLKGHPGNPNKHPQSQIRMLAKSIESYGWRHPIVVSKRSGFIVAGHARREAALKLECKVPVDMQDFDNEADEMAVLLADNVLPELAELDKELFDVGKELLEAAEIDLETIGIEDLESDEDEDVNVSDDYIPEYKVVIRCRDENHQAELLERLEAEGLECQLLIL